MALATLGVNVPVVPVGVNVPAVALVLCPFVGDQGVVHVVGERPGPGQKHGQQVGEEQRRCADPLPHGRLSAPAAG